MPGHRQTNCRIGGTAVLAVLVFISASALLAAGQTAVTTYHYDNYRTGWNQNEISADARQRDEHVVRSAADRRRLTTRWMRSRWWCRAC